MSLLPPAFALLSDNPEIAAFLLRRWLRLLRDLGPLASLPIGCMHAGAVGVRRFNDALLGELAPADIVLRKVTRVEVGGLAVHNVDNDVSLGRHDGEIVKDGFRCLFVSILGILSEERKFTYGWYLS